MWTLPDSLLSLLLDSQYPGRPSALLQEEHYLSGPSPVSGDGHSAERRFTGCVYSKGTGEEKTVCFKILPSQLCFVI